jgi:hypothetical protein
MDIGKSHPQSAEQGAMNKETENETSDCRDNDTENAY